MNEQGVVGLELVDGRSELAGEEFDEDDITELWAAVELASYPNVQS